MSVDQRSLACPQCHYDLVGVQPRGRRLACPECGHEFSFGTGDLELPFISLVVWVVGPPLVLTLGALTARVSGSSLGRGFLPLAPLAVIAAPIAFAVLMSRRWPQPWRSAVLVRYLVAGLALGVVTFGVWLLATLVVFAWL